MLCHRADARRGCSRIIFFFQSTSDSKDAAASTGQDMRQANALVGLRYGMCDGCAGRRGQPVVAELELGRKPRAHSDWCVQ